MYDIAGYHVFLKVMIDDVWIDVDATWSPALAKVLSHEYIWDGVSSQKTVVPYTEYFSPQTQDEEWEIKKNLTDERESDLEDEMWIEEFNRWVREVS